MSDDLHPEIVTSLDASGAPVRLRVEGEVDLYTAGDFQAALAEAAAAGPDVVVDLTGVAFMDSSGLRALLETRRQVDGSGGSLRLVVEPGGAVERLIGLAGVDGLFPPADSGPERG